MVNAFNILLKLLFYNVLWLLRLCFHISSLSCDLRRQLPNAKGLSKNNIRYPKRCYCLNDKTNENLSRLEENFD